MRRGHDWMLTGPGMSEGEPDTSGEDPMMTLLGVVAAEAHPRRPHVCAGGRMS
jgi:hypothetical protein